LFSHVSAFTVEERVALSYLSALGNDWHAYITETRVWLVLYSALCWDAIFSSTFPAPSNSARTFLTLPLDLLSAHFFARRKKLFEERFQSLRQMSAELFDAELCTQWAIRSRKDCALVSWDWYKLDDLRAICAAMGARTLCGIFKLLAEDFFTCAFALLLQHGT
jgi:hypothetical protein